MIRIRIPATTANLGPGFDCLGLALDLWNTFEVRFEGDGYGVKVIGEGEGKIATDSSNLVVTTFLDELRHFGKDAPKGAQFMASNTVPCASGLGSSSTATLAGVIAAQAYINHLEGKEPDELDQNLILNRAVHVEGHGDNVAPALLGGLVVVVPDQDHGVLSHKFSHPPLRCVVCVPNFLYLTTNARKALPESYSKADAIFNIGRAMLVMQALASGDYDLLAKSMNDRIHEQYRLKDIPGANAAKDAAKSAGAISVALSGAGPGIIAFANDSYDAIGKAMKSAFSEARLSSRYWILDFSESGVQISRLPQ